MSLTKFTEDVDIIQALDKRPNAIGGLNAAELQAKFDEAANLIKDYLNGTLTDEMDTQVAALKAVNRLVYCAQDVPKTALPADIITVGKNWFYPKPAVGDTVLGKNMYVARVTTISGNDATLTGIGTVLTPKDFNVLNLLTVKAVGGVGGNIVAEGDLSVSGYTGLAGDLDVTGDTDISGDLDVVGNLTVAVDATVNGALDVSGSAVISGDIDVSGAGGESNFLGSLGVAEDLDVGGDLGVTGGASFGDEVLISSGGIGVQGAATFADGVGVTGDISASGDVSVGDDLTVTGDASVGGSLTVTGDISGDNLTLEDDLTAVNGTFSGVSASTVELKDGSNHTVRITNGEDELMLAGANNAPVSIGNVGTLDVTGSISVDGDLDVGDDATVAGDLTAGSVSTSALEASSAELKGMVQLTDMSETPPTSIYMAASGTGALVFWGNNHSSPVEIGNIATPTTNGSAANKAYVDTAVSGRVAVAQGVGHAGEFLVVGSDGNVTTVAMTAWAGGSY